MTITTLEELRLIEEENMIEILIECRPAFAVFDEFDPIRAHGLGVQLD
jgi:hypothetical protein